MGMEELIAGAGDSSIELPQRPKDQDGPDVASEPL